MALENNGNLRQTFTSCNITVTLSAESINTKALCVSFTKTFNTHLFTYYIASCSLCCNLHLKYRGFYNLKLRAKV